MSTLTAVLISGSAGLAIGFMIAGFFFGRPKDLPTIDQVARFMDGAVDLELEEALRRRRDARLRMGGRTVTPRQSDSPPARISRMYTPGRPRRRR